MQTLINSQLLIYGDINYTRAVNYEHKYNAPITLNFGPKHQRTKYMLGAGTCDNISLLQDGSYIYVVSQNSGLNYIGLEVINTETKQIEGNVFLDSGDLEYPENICFGILDMETKEQVKLLCQYLD